MNLQRQRQRRHSLSTQHATSLLAAQSSVVRALSPFRATRATSPSLPVPQRSRSNGSSTELRRLSGGSPLLYSGSSPGVRGAAVYEAMGPLYAGPLHTADHTNYGSTGGGSPGIGSGNGGSSRHYALQAAAQRNLSRASKETMDAQAIAFSKSPPRRASPSAAAGSGGGGSGRENYGGSGGGAGNGGRSPLSRSFSVSGSRPLSPSLLRPGLGGFSSTTGGNMLSSGGSPRDRRLLSGSPLRGFFSGSSSPGSSRVTSPGSRPRS